MASHRRTRKFVYYLIMQVLIKWINEFNLIKKKVLREIQTYHMYIKNEAVLHRSLFLFWNRNSSEGGGGELKVMLVAPKVVKQNVPSQKC